MKLLSPTKYANSIFDIDLQALKDGGVRVLALDIDNTLVATSTKAPTDEVLQWIEKVKDHGLELILVSNNSKNRVAAFNEALKLSAVHRALKPLPHAFAQISKRLGVAKSEICMIGDQIFTDIVGANLAGVISVLVLPLSTDEGAGVRFKRLIERAVIRRSKADTYCLIGNPVAHSRSPLLHGIVYDYHRINALYMLCHTRHESLGHIVSQFKHTGVRGFNITVPFKQDIIPFLDELTEDARQIGSVNTVKIENGRCKGYNTDGDGFAMQLLSDSTVIEGSKVKLIGAGGSAPAIVYALLKNGAASITVYNRTAEKAQAIADRFDRVAAMPLADFNPTDCDILINTTSVGLHPNDDASPVSSLDGISPQARVYDIIYSPPETAFMKLAKAQGCFAQNGCKLLIYQGLLADEVWFGRKITEDALVRRILKEMGVPDE
ncbi:MAG: Shikimate dehydrogenase [Firmicutes bacterium ADurb.Bin193]|nr:MAG: Shikimate dehydrogenase [Firmicutes bacterium ADurb.Bin193]